MPERGTLPAARAPCSRPGSVRPLRPGRGGRVTCVPAHWATEEKPRSALPPSGPLPAPRCGVGRASPGAPGEGAASSAQFPKVFLEGSHGLGRGLVCLDAFLGTPRLRVPPPLPARLPLRRRCCPSSRPLAPASPGGGSARAKFFRISWRLHRACSRVPSPLREGSAGQKGEPASFGAWGRGPGPFPPRRRRGRRCVRSPSSLPSGPESLHVVVAVVTAASLRATSISEVLAEQALENQPCLCYGNPVGTQPGGPSHPCTPSSVPLSPCIFLPSPALPQMPLGDTSLALRDKPVFLVLFTGRLLKGL